MRRFFFILFLFAFLFCGGWLLYHKDKIDGPRDVLWLAGQQISRLGNTPNARQTPYRGRPENVIRIASFNVDNLTFEKSNDLRVSAVLTETFRQFDVIALQEVDASDRYLLKRLLKRINAKGRQFVAINGATDDNGKQLAIVYDQSTIELDQHQTYTVNDPDNVMSRDPQVAWFRVKATQVSPFTFSLVNVHLQPESSSNELLQISRIFRAVRNDGRGEDDVILVGDFGVDSSKLNQVAITHGLEAINLRLPTATVSRQQLDNVIIDPMATGEYTGETGVHDFLKLHNLTMQQALAISDHLPVWAEFSVTESQAIPQVADNDPDGIK